MFQGKLRYQYFKYVIQRQQLKTWLGKSYQLPSVGLVMIQTRRRRTVWVIIFSFHPYHFLRICSVIVDRTGTMLCSCKHFERIGLPGIWLVLLHCVIMKCLGWIIIVLNLLDLHTMTLLSIGGVATCIMPTDLHHHSTLYRNITCWQ